MKEHVALNGMYIIKHFQIHNGIIQGFYGFH